MKAPIPKPIPPWKENDEEVKDFDDNSDDDGTPNKPQSIDIPIDGLSGPRTIDLRDEMSLDFIPTLPKPAKNQKSVSMSQQNKSIPDTSSSRIYNRKNESADIWKKDSLKTSALIDS